MLFYGCGFVAMIYVAVFSFLHVDMGVEGTVGGIVMLLLALAALSFLIKRTYQFVVLENIYAWAI